MQPASNVEKHATGAKRVKTCNQRQALENTCNWRQALENMQSASSAGKHATSVKRGKTCNRRQAWDNIQLNERQTGVKRRK